MEISWRRRERQTKTLEFFNEFKRDCGGGGSRSATILEFSNDFENAMGSIGKKRQKAPVQVQNRYRRSAGVSSDSQRDPLNVRSLQASRDEAPGSSRAAGPVDLHWATLVA